jgi:hypothetical protein
MYAGRTKIKKLPMERINTRMERVLEETCRVLPHGGDHELRAFIARKLADAALIGHTLLGELGIVARKALADYQSGRHFDAAVSNQNVAQFSPQPRNRTAASNDIRRFGS